MNEKFQPMELGILNLDCIHFPNTFARCQIVRCSEGTWLKVIIISLANNNNR